MCRYIPSGSSLVPINSTSIHPVNKFVSTECTDPAVMSPIPTPTCTYVLVNYAIVRISYGSTSTIISSLPFSNLLQIFILCRLVLKPIFKL